VNGHECQVVVQGQEVPWAEDIAIVRANDPQQDSGAVAELFGGSIPKYKAITPRVGCHLTIECFLNSNTGGYRRLSFVPSSGARGTGSRLPMCMAPPG